MAKSTPPRAAARAQTADPRREPSLWFRILLQHGSLGPGKFELLRLVDEFGSVSAAAKRLGMSHARSVKLVAEMNALGPNAVIATRIGGLSGGGAALTDAGRELLERYELLDAAVRAAAAPHLERLQRSVGG